MQKHYNIYDYLGTLQQTYKSNGSNVVPTSMQTHNPYGGERWTNSNLTTKESTLLNWVGKEKDNESKLGDHGVRKYEYETGRFISIDPLWSKYYGWTPYQYSGNSPIDWQDGNGLLKIAAEGTKIYSDRPDYQKQINNTEKYKSYVDDLSNAIIPFVKATGILERMMEITNVSKKSILSDLKFGEGPEIFINQLYKEYDEFDAMPKDEKFEMALGITGIAEDPNNYYGDGSNSLRLYRLAVTIHGYLHDKFDLTHSQIYYILGGNKKRHPLDSDYRKMLEDGTIKFEDMFNDQKDIYKQEVQP